MPVFDERNKEKIHWMLYDCVPATPREMEGEGDEDSGFQKLLGSGTILSFFQDLQRKTKLETNMDASGLLSRNSYEIRAMRVVIAPLPVEEDEVGGGGSGTGGGGGGTGGEGGGGLEGNGNISPRVIEEFIYNSVTTLRVGEKLYIEAPTFLFPAGAGVIGGSNGEVGVGHGEANPMATWRFAEPIVIPPQQSFRVEIAFPRGIQTLTNLKEAMTRVWVLLDGYLTRDVQ